jgi:hypothetical protein
MSVMIYFYLPNEGVDVRHPTSAELIRDDIYKITGLPPDETENWKIESSF